MSEEKSLLQQLDPTRRAFVKKLMVAGAAAPVIATFSIDALAQGINSSSASASFHVCQPDEGYIGPGRFAAHLTYVGDSSDPAGRTNGEIHLVVNRDGDDDDHGKGPKGDKNQKKKPGRRVNTQLQLVSDPAFVFAWAAILINGQYAVTLNAGDSYFDATNVDPNFCDLDFVLNAMAGGTATALVSATFLGNPVSLSGAINAAGPGFDFVNLKP